MKDVAHHQHAANAYASGPLDRADILRADVDAMAHALNHAEARFVPVWKGQNLVVYGARPEGWLSGPETAYFLKEATDIIFLGFDALRHPHFALDLSHLNMPPVADGAVFEDLRKIGPMMADDDGAILAYARGLVHWHGRHRFCGVCGAPTQSQHAGHQRLCTNNSCRTPHFPRTDPAVIMLVHDGADQIILGRQHDWPPGRSSVLAGFVEPGESLEDAVAREVMEEVGVPVTDIHYSSSQPWPFPSSIMLGFVARATSKELTINTSEIADARWVSREDVLNCPNDEQFALPRRDSIAYRLIQDWAKS